MLGAQPPAVTVTLQNKLNKGDFYLHKTEANSGWGALQESKKEWDPAALRGPKQCLQLQ